MYRLPLALRKLQPARATGGRRSQPKPHPLGLRVSLFALLESLGLTNNLRSSGDSTGSPPSQSEAAYDSLAGQHPSNILALNHETEQTTA